MPIELRAEEYCLTPLLEFLSNDFANKYRKVWDFEEGTVGVFVRDKLMLRNSQTLTVTVIVEHRVVWREFVVTILASGGRQGLFRLDFWGAENGAEGWAEREIRKTLSRIDSGGRTISRRPAERPFE
ncbi:MAG: hypothetical protein ACFFEF_03955 [Candidatus Thorarchaeota archaeon]